jgi:phospholipid/cholesterol/gamma-HCH transport system ATP-binding protein
MDAPPGIPAIRVEGLVNRFGGQTVHDGLSFEVRQHEIMGVVGGSGTGKTVLLRTILGLHRPQAGSVQVYGRNIHELSATERVAMSRSYGVTFQPRTSSCRCARPTRSRRMHSTSWCSST